MDWLRLIVKWVTILVSGISCEQGVYGAVHEEESQLYPGGDYDKKKWRVLRADAARKVPAVNAVFLDANDSLGQKEGDERGGRWNARSE